MVEKTWSLTVDNSMHWRAQVAQLECEGNFDIAIFLLGKVVQENPDDVEAYIFLLYRLMDSIVEDTCYWSNVSKDPLKEIKGAYYDAKAFEEYRFLIQKYFDESYAKFSDNPEYLFYASGVLIVQYWFCCMRLDDAFLDAMRKKAFKMGYNTILEHAWDYRKRASNDSDVIFYARQLINDVSLQEQLACKGVVADYVFGGHIEWAKEVLEKSLNS